MCHQRGSAEGTSGVAGGAVTEGVCIAVMPVSAVSSVPVAMMAVDRLAGGCRS